VGTHFYAIAIIFLRKEPDPSLMESSSLTG
jgi:hypothetical protein